MISSDKSRALQTGFMSDLKLISGDGKLFDVHKLVLCTQSDFFMAACTVDMKVGLTLSVVVF